LRTTATNTSVILEETQGISSQQHQERSHIEMFLQALRYRGLYQDEPAVQLLIRLAEESNIEELYILAYEWSMRYGLSDSIQRIEQVSFRNPVLRDFIFLQTIRAYDDVAEKRNLISDFLNHNPQNVFSPQLRLLLFTTNPIN